MLAGPTPENATPVCVWACLRPGNGFLVAAFSQEAGSKKDTFFSRDITQEQNQPQLVRMMFKLQLSLKGNTYREPLAKASRNYAIDS